MHTGIEASGTRGMHAGHGSSRLWRMPTCHQTGSERGLRVVCGRYTGGCRLAWDGRIAFVLDLERNALVVPVSLKRTGRVVVVYTTLLWV